ncbi:cupin domain-containing protein [Altererythrobacter sp.]|uniref:cupin domain-containing protein n=1 Tax=Altererythrobacter sp. TaxID=1872480 RepID=UPI003CFF3E3D
MSDGNEAFGGANRAGAMEGFREELEAASMRPLWDLMRELAPLEPARGGEPFRWTWSDLRPLVEQAGRLISAEEAERRVLVLENPAFRGEGRITSSLYAGIQLVLPGETAPSHRHTAAALRFVLEGTGSYTAVNGERVIMSPGDFIVTPSGTFHDHGNDSDQAVIWLDGLDVFVVNLLNAAFGEAHPEKRQPIMRPLGDSLARYGQGLLPKGQAPTRSSLFCWPYARTLEALRTVARSGPVDDATGVCLNYTDPTTGQSPIRTMTASMSLFPPGFRGQLHRSTAGSVFAVVEGKGRVTVGDESWEIGPRDVFVAPGWTWTSFESDGELVLFSFSDEALQRYLGFWREERRDGNVKGAD